MPVAVRELFFEHFLFYTAPNTTSVKLELVGEGQASPLLTPSLWGFSQATLQTPKLRAAGMWRHDLMRRDRGCPGGWCRLPTTHYALAFLKNVFSLIVRGKKNLFHIVG